MAFEAARWSHWDNTKKPNYEALDRLRQIADDWSAEGQHTYAGYVLFSAVDWAWGDGDAVEQCAEQALRELKIAVDLASSHDLDRIAALRVLLNVNGMNYTGANPSDVRALLGSMYEELGQTLLKLSMDAKNPTDRAGLLAHGFVLETEFQGTWRPVFRGFEVNGSAFRLGAGYLAMEIPSAFTLFKNAGDYEAAQTVAAMCPEAFTSHGLRGWRTAIAGLLNPDEAVERFTEASAIFARDVQDEETSKETGHWSSINVDLWAKYFAARAAVAEIVRAPGRATELIRRAGDALNGTESGWGSPQVTCLRTLVNALNDILDSDAVGGVAQAKETLLRRVRRSGLNDEDRLALKFLDQAAHAFALASIRGKQFEVRRHCGVGRCGPKSAGQRRLRFRGGLDLI